MNPIKIAAGALAGLALFAGAATATAAGPADVTVRIEGQDTTIVPRTAVRTTDAPVVKDGTHSCSGTSAGGALERATGGDWTGPWFDFGDYGVYTIRGESHPFDKTGNFWAFYVNDAEAPAGICGTELAAGDEVLFAPQPEFDTGEPAKGILRLKGVPSSALPGQSVTLEVVRTVTEYPEPDFKPTPKTAPAAGATISGPGVSLTTDGDGRASFVTSARGPLTLQATKPGEIRSAGETVCVTDGADGACGTQPPPPPCRTIGRDGFCGQPDHRAAFGVIRSVAEQQRFARGQGPRELQGTVEADASGLQSVRIRLVRNDRGRCSRFDADRLEFRRVRRCRATAGKWATVGETADWRYLLPERLARGRYVLDVEVRDKAGNVNRIWQRGRNRVVFHVG